MIELNLLPSPEGPDPEMRKLLSPGIAYFLELAFERAQQSQTKEELLLWGRIWASLLHLRREYLQPGFSPADNFVEELIIDGNENLLVQALYGD